MDRHGITQINLRKSHTVTNELLVAHMLANNISLALIQEPYVRRHGSVFKIPHLNGLHLAAVTSPKSAIIFNKDCIESLFVPQLSNDRLCSDHGANERNYCVLCERLPASIGRHPVGNPNHPAACRGDCR
jgi:hypothetical protein